MERSGLSNAAAAAVDSALFVWIAFPGFLWAVAVGQFGAKVAGGFLIALALERFTPVGTIYARPLGRL